MADQRQLIDDVQELLTRINPDGMVKMTHGGRETIRATAHLIPTLAERGYTDEAKRLAKILADSRDEEGGWDDTWTTVFALEAFIGLRLRQVYVEDSDIIIEYAVKVLKSSLTLESQDHELRLARALVLSGIVKNDANLIDAGLLRARTAADKGLEMKRSRGEALHGLLALVDLHSITNDKATFELIEGEIERFKLDKPESWYEEEEVEIIARVGTIMEKLSYHDVAAKAYELSMRRKPKILDSVALKHRVELGARLFADKLEKEEVKQNVIKKDSDVEKTANPVTAEKIDLPPQNLIEKPEEHAPAIKMRFNKNVNISDAKVSVVIVQSNSKQIVEDTLEALKIQSELIREIVIVTREKTNEYNWQNNNTDLRVITASSFDSLGKCYEMAVRLIEGEWIWILQAGTKPETGALKRLTSRPDADENIRYLADKAGELKSAYKDLYINPSISSSRILLHKSCMEETGFDFSLDSDPFWEFAIKSLHVDDILEIVAEENESIEEDKSDSASQLEKLISDRFIVYNRYTTDNAGVKRKRQNAIAIDRKLAYSNYQRSHEPLVSIIIPHYNLPDMLNTAIDKILENTHQIPFEIIVVDNGSENTTSDMVRSLEDKGILYLRNKRNEGFARACNYGAQNAKGDYILLLNNDTEVKEGWLKTLLEAIQEDKSVGIAGSLLLYPDNTVQHAGIVFDDQGFPGLYLGKFSADDKNVQKKRNFQAVSAASMLIKKKLYKKLNGMDAGFINGWEDIDFCLRARELGWKSLYVPESQVIHHTEQTPGRKNYEERNRRLFFSRWQGRITPDKDKYAREDGYDIQVSNGEKSYIPKENSGITLNTESDKEASMSMNMADEAVALEEEVIVKEGIADLLATADGMIKDGHYDDAERELVGGKNQVNGNVKHRAMYWTLLGDARFRLNRPDDAMQCYQKAVKDDPSAQRAWIGIGTWHLINDDLEKSQDIFTRVIKLEPENNRGHLGLGNVELKRGDFNKAMLHFHSAFQLVPDHRPSIVGLVAAAVQSGRMLEAQQPLEQYLEWHPEDFEARFHLAAILFGGDNFDRARQEAERVLEANPEHRGAIELMIHLDEA